MNERIYTTFDATTGTLPSSSGETETAVYKCTVTDSASNVAYSANVTVTLSN